MIAMNCLPSGNHKKHTNILYEQYEGRFRKDNKIEQKNQITVS